MDQAGSRQDWIEELEEMIWTLPARSLASTVEQLFGRFMTCGRARSDVLVELSDETLVTALQKDLWAPLVFEALLVKRYGEDLKKWFFRQGASADQTLELIQTLYLRFWRNRLASYQPTSTFRAYLSKAVHNLWLDVRTKRTPLAALDRAPVPVATENPEQEAIARELERRVAAAVAQLSEQHQRVFHGIEHGQSPQEVARLPGLTVKLVSRLLFQTRRHIEHVLGLPSQVRPYQKSNEPRTRRRKESLNGEVPTHDE
jgi:RNA polymerase sigma factor (sigma-70 family)